MTNDDPHQLTLFTPTYLLHTNPAETLFAFSLFVLGARVAYSIHVNSAIKNSTHSWDGVFGDGEWGTDGDMLPPVWRSDEATIPLQTLGDAVTVAFNEYIY